MASIIVSFAAQSAVSDRQWGGGCRHEEDVLPGSGVS